MQHNQTADRSFATVATETLLANTTLPGASNETPAATKTGTAEFGEQRSVARTENRTDLISILMVDDHALIREGLHQLLAMEQDMKIVGEAVDGYDQPFLPCDRD
jgi:PleD family two-component response regulator